MFHFTTKGGINLKAMIKVIWLYAAVLLRDYVIKLIAGINAKTLAAKINEVSPIDLAGLNLEDKLSVIFTDLNNVVYLTILFLGLDLINGQFTGVIKGPFKILMNTIVYILGFSILFFIVQKQLNFSFLDFQS
jgi:hypothetical protein